MTLFAASQASWVSFQMQKSNDFHCCNTVWLTSVMLMSATVHHTNTCSQVLISTTKISVNCYWIALHRLPHPCNCCSCNSDAMAINGMKGERWTEHCQVTKGEVCPMLSAFCHTIRLMRCATHARTAQGHSLGTAKKRDGELQKTISEAQHPYASKSLQSIFIGKYPGLERDLQTKISKHIPRLSFSHELKWKYLWYHCKPSLE